MNKRNLATLVAATFVISGCSGDENTSMPTPDIQSPSQSAFSSPTSSPTITTSPGATYPVAECGEFKDNSSEELPPAAQDQVLYYLFVCDSDQRVIVRIKNGQGQVVHADLYTSYSFGTISFASGKPVETMTFKSGGGFAKTPNYWGTPTDLHVEGLVRLVGPTSNISDFYDQDCKDFAAMNGFDDCADMDGSSSERFINEGDRNDWINETAS